jgi:hypothetical protein
MPPLQRPTSNLKQTIRSFALLTTALAAAVLTGALIAKQAPRHRYRDGIGAPRAIAAARAFMPGELTTATVASTRSGILNDFDQPPDAPPDYGDERVWAIAFNGTFPYPSCGPPMPNNEPHTCAPPATSMIVIVDYHDAHVLYAQSPWPSP